MKRSFNLLAITLGLTLGVAAAQNQPPEPYPGQREHKEPPKDWFCEQAAPDRAHRCDCPGMTPDPRCKTPAPEDEQAPTVQESQRCKSYCYKDHCHCQKRCDS